MKSFKDNQGHPWHISLSLAKCRQIREKIGLDLLNPSHLMQVLASLTDQLTFCFLLVEDQANAMQPRLTVDDFEERLYGDKVSLEISNTFLEECELFFQKLGQHGMAALVKKSIESRNLSQARMESLITTGQFDSLCEKAEAEIRKEWQKVVGSGSPSSPQSPA